MTDLDEIVERVFDALVGARTSTSGTRRDAIRTIIEEALDERYQDGLEEGYLNCHTWDS